MKLPVSNTNAPVWRDITVKSDLPAELKPLEEISKNLWWVWNSDAVDLFRTLSLDLWRKSGENPVVLLQNLSTERLEEIRNDREIMDKIAKVYSNFKKYMSVPMRKDVPSISYFSMEYGLCNCLKIYSGGLGVLDGDFFKVSADS
jgi:starch phosphorylase